MDDNFEEWPAQLSRRIGAAIHDAREAQDVSAVKLAARTADLGYPIHRVAISKLESGERDITVPELVILAAALNTVPLALLLTDAADATTEILPGREMTGAAAIGWFTGTTRDTPAGVTRARSATSRLELTMRLNEIDEDLDMQRHNVVKAESILQRLEMSDEHELRKHQEDRIKHLRELVNSLEEQRKLIVHVLANEDSDGR